MFNVDRQLLWYIVSIVDSFQRESATASGSEVFKVPNCDTYRDSSLDSACLPENLLHGH